MPRSTYEGVSQRDLERVGDQIMPSNHQNTPELVRHSDKQFYTSLEKYFPLCYSGKDWYHPLSCLIFMDIFLIGCFLLFIITTSRMGSQNINGLNTIILVNILTIILLNLFYLLTLGLNPGVRNLSTIEEEQYEKDGKIYCDLCKGYRTVQMKHCLFCRVCVEGLDHHCGFFGKCIAGCQKFAFYLTLTMIFVAFVVALVSISMIMGL